jgi:hypothetical protein
VWWYRWQAWRLAKNSRQAHERMSNDEWAKTASPGDRAAILWATLDE